MSEQIANLLSEAAAISAEAASLAQDGKVEKALTLERKADQLRKKARLASQTDNTTKRDGGKKTRARREGRGETTRGLAVASLVEIGVPASPKAVAEYVSVRFGKTIEYRLFASLRRDEFRAWSAPNSARAVYVVPALEGQRFCPVRGKVTLSDWSLERRIIGPWSERVDHLFATRNLVRQVAWLRDADPKIGESLVELVAVYASTIPGAVEHGQPLEPGRVEQSIEAELEALGRADEQWRAEAAARAREVLSATEQLWGGKAPAVAIDLA